MGQLFYIYSYGQNNTIGKLWFQILSLVRQTDGKNTDVCDRRTSPLSQKKLWRLISTNLRSSQRCWWKLNSLCVVCRLANRYRNFGGICCLHLLGLWVFGLHVFSEKSVTINGHGIMSKQNWILQTNKHLQTASVEGGLTNYATWLTTS